MAIPEIEVLFRDSHLVVVNKPPGVAVHGSHAEDPTCLVSLVAQQLAITQRALHPVSRLDLPVSGVVAITMSDRGRRSLTQQYQGHQVTRTYVALVEGRVPESEGTWDAPIGVDRHDRRRRVINGLNQRPAKTRYRVVWSTMSSISFVELTPQTGRTHQLRVHASQVGRCPILGDRRYGGPTTIGLARGAVLAVPRVMLHAERLTFSHPHSGATMQIEASVPSDFGEIIEALKVS